MNGQTKKLYWLICTIEISVPNASTNTTHTGHWFLWMLGNLVATKIILRSLADYKNYFCYGSS